MKRTLGLALALVLGLVPGAWAQVAGGNIYGTVTDESGAVMPGANVTAVATAIGSSRSTTTGSQGDFRFVSLDPGTYRITVSLQGFATVNREVIVNTGANVNLGFSLKVASLEEAITVEDVTPTVDAKRVGTATTFTQDELSKIPQGRDPWAVLNAVPGVIVDRVSIAGNEAGQQSIFVGKGAAFQDTMWSYDGVVITDVTSYGASSSYFDFDSFEEINVSTGGGDLKVQTGGVGLNFVVKRGTNAFHGSARSYFSHKDLQSTNTPDDIAGDARLLDGNADHIEQINDWGLDLGGPLVKDKLWFWAAYNKNDNRLYRLRSGRDKSLLKNYNVKLNWQASPKDQISALWFYGAKEKFGRDPGYASNNQALWNQGNFFEEEDCGFLPCGLKYLWKLEWNRTFGNNFNLNGKYAFFNWGYGFDSVTGDDQDLSIDRVAGTARGSAQRFRFLKPWHTVNLDGSYFAAGLGGNHELKFGFGYRHWPNTSSASYGGNQVVAIRNNDDPTDPFGRVAQVWRSGVVKFEANYTNFYVGDTFTKDRLTINAGLRYDRQTAGLSPSTAGANPLFPNLVPALEFDGSVPGIEWNDISPRVGLTVALDESRKTIARASYARYAGQLGPIDAQFNSPITYNYNYLAYQWVDRNNDGFAQRDEVLTGQGVLYYAGINPDDPTSVSSINQIDPDYHANHDQEVIVGLEREVLPNFSIGAAYTWRRGADTASYTPRIDATGRVLTSADYVALPAVTAGGLTAQPYAPNPARLGNGARLLTNRPDFNLSYSGIEISANKRLSNRWMFRGSFSWMDWTEDIGPNGFQNPTSVDRNTVIQGGYPGGANSGLCGACIDGGIVALKSYGAKTDTFFNAKWQFAASAMYQLPGDLELGASLLGRQGYPKAIFIGTSLGADGTRNVLPTGGGLDLERHDDFWNLDLRLGKDFKIAGTSSLNVTVDLFNVFNSDTVLQRNRQINSQAFEQILEIINPRILRLGVRLQF